MVRNGYLVICNKCETECFVSSDDGVDTAIIKQEDMPNGWSHIGYPIGDLCPECSKKLNEILGKFFAEK